MLSLLGVVLLIMKPISIRTIERNIAYLQNHGIIKREGGRKKGRWVVIDEQYTIQ